jgi:SAM-dependent methyltransferase
MTLRERLVKAKKTRWLDVGCGGARERGFLLMDTFPAKTLPAAERRRYVQCDIVNLPDAVARRLGKFDLVRMQHAFEHFSYEEGRQVLKNCARLLKLDGIILISVPDLRIHIRRYLNDGYKTSGYRWWAHNRIPEDSPASFYFAIFAYSMPHEQHKWCYDFAGLRYQLKSCGEFKDIRKLGVRNPLASEPFTHNRSDEDLCVIAVKR